MNEGTRLEPFYGREPAAASGGFAVADAAIDRPLAEACRQFVRERGIPFRDAACAVWALLAARLTGNGSVTLLEVGRSRRPLVCEISKERTFLDLFRDFGHRNGARTESSGPGGTCGPEAAPTNCGIMFAGTEPADIDDAARGLQALLMAAPDTDDLGRLSLRYDRAAFTEGQAREMLGRFVRLLDFAVRRPEALLSEADMLDEAEIGGLLRAPEDVRPHLPDDRTVHALIEKTWAGSERETAMRFGGRSFSLGEIDALANRIAHYLIGERGLRREERVAILLERRPELIAAMLGVLKAGGAYVPIDPGYPEERVRHMVADSGARTVLSSRRWIRLLNRLQWECPDLDAYLCMDSDDALAEPESEHNMLMERGLWEYFGAKADNDISGGGWFNSYTGEPFSAVEMEEFAENVFLKLRPYLRPDARVLEIGCASGLTMFKLAPHVGYYHGTDLSRVIIEKVRARIEAEGISNISVECVAAHEIGSIREDRFDIVVMNSVIQMFHGHNYLRAAIRQALGKMADKGILFIGDIMDHDLKEELCRSLSEHKRAHPGHRTKTDWSAELFVSRAFLEDLAGEFPALKAVEFSRKHGEIENELTRFRFDAVFHVDKSSPPRPHAKRKQQHDRRHLMRYPDTRPEPRAEAGQLAYVLYTSGSTGKPKGVMIEHRAVVNFLEGMGRLFPVGRGSRVLSLTTVSFDIFVLESLFPLARGATIVLADEAEQREPGALERLLRSEKPDLVQMTPSRMHAFLQEEAHLSALTDVPYLLLGGEPLPAGLLRRLNGAVWSRIFNMYGPTETTVWSTAEDVTGRAEANIGGPIQGTEVLILDVPTGRLLPEGAVGEICIAGAGLARGYLNLPRETETKFVPHPYRPGERIYRTGDLGVRLPGGKFQCLGRIDHQIKVRGYRIEPAEIESVLTACEGIREAAVAVCADQGADGDGEAVLCAYFTADGQTPAVQDLRKQLARTLPEYMIPSLFVPLERMPLTPNGKIDRRALPSPKEAARIGAGGPRMPRSATERELAGIWAGVFGAPVGIADDFYEIGGHSILAVKLTTAIRERLGVDLTLAAFFREPTIEGVARLIDSGVFAAAESGREAAFRPSGRESLRGPLPLDEMQQAY
jgi:amino acid adenylation domain-containing protein